MSTIRRHIEGCAIGRRTVVCLLLTSAVFAQDLPKGDGAIGADSVPKLMLNDLPDIPLPEGPASSAPSGVTSQELRKLDTDLERARKTAASRERLWKAGVLSKVEAEQSALRVVRLARDLAEARAVWATQEFEEKRKTGGADALSQQVVAEAEAALTRAKEAAREASERWAAAQRAAAELRVKRERQLLAAGAGSRSAVQRAETVLQNLAPLTGR